MDQLEQTVLLPRYTEKIFSTSQGDYLLNPRTGLFTREPGPYEPLRIVGGLAPGTPIETPGGEVRLEDLVGEDRAMRVFATLARGVTFGFTPHFYEGYFPFGVACEARDVVYVRSGAAVFSEWFKGRALGGDPSVRLELGSRITQVYKERLTEDQRGYKVIDTTLKIEE